MAKSVHQASLCVLTIGTAVSVFVAIIMIVTWNAAQEPLALLSVGVRLAQVDRRRLGGYVRRDWTCVCFQTTAEAARRVALLTLLCYDPPAMRTRHGRLQGRLLTPLILHTEDEVKRTEAAAAIQAAWLARGERGPVLAELLRRREERRAAAELLVLVAAGRLR